MTVGTGAKFEIIGHQPTQAFPSIWTKWCWLTLLTGAFVHGSIFISSQGLFINLALFDIVVPPILIHDGHTIRMIVLAIALGYARQLYDQSNSADQATKPPGLT
jgi:hypothetical protein